MKSDAVDRIVNSVLYEGYMLYPYRRSSLKNRHRWNFGIVHPEGAGTTQMTTECLVEGLDPALSIQVRFLQLYEQDAWQEAVERRIDCGQTGIHEFQFDDLHGEIDISRQDIQAELQRIRVQVRNRTVRGAAKEDLLRSFVSTHTILFVQNGQFVSLLDPPDRFQEAAADCRNEGTWPVLAGSAAERDYMLSSPIILYDYPRVAPESPGDLFDSTEIDEILTLRILTLTESEKDEMRRSGERERRLLEHAESLTAEQLLKLHGTMRDVRCGLKRGDRVRLRPKPGGDVFDIVLANRVAIVESVEEDFDNRTHVAVVIEDDPGKDLGVMRQPGHRFFFSVDEVELIA
jgi:hypothetical protein